MNRPLLKLLGDRLQIALGSLALVEKELLEVYTVVDNQLAKVYDEHIRGEEENSDSKFFITPPVSVYDND